MIAFPNKKYKIIYADPPWSYKDKALAGNRGACCKYPVMSINDICELPIHRIADDDCILFMWVTMPKLNECFEVINAWGFEYKTNALHGLRGIKSLILGFGVWEDGQEQTQKYAYLQLKATLKGKVQESYQ
jgi:N6-adenosine-specific RNA methylase IME4